MTNLCTLHNEPMIERESKNKVNDDGSPKTYWAHTADGQLCFGEPMGKQYRRTAVVPKAPVGPPKAVSGETMSKEEWREKDERIARLTLAKTFISAGVTFDQARENGDLEEWTKWVLEG